MKNGNNARYTEETKKQAKLMYLGSHSPKEIAAKLKINSVRTVQLWVQKGGWNAEMPVASLELALERRLILLTDRDKKTSLELTEIDKLIKNIVILRRVEMENKTALVSLAERKGAINRGESPHQEHSHKSSNKKKKNIKNDISHVTKDMFQVWIDSLYSYQKIQFDNRDKRERWTLKSRQIGLTYQASGEALYKAIFEGRNQTFLSASRAQAEVFKSYIVHIAQQFLNIELKGGVIKLSNGAELRFIGTNKNTAQSYSSDVYIDEAFWINKYDKIYEVASAMATLKHFKITIFSTVSTKQHKAYAHWSGAWWKGKDVDRNKILFPTKDDTHRILRRTPQVCPDRVWRFVITLDDAIAGGNPHIDKTDLEERYSKDAFSYLFACKFMDELDSVFTLADVLKCPFEIDKWTDFEPHANRPIGNKEVWIGYDPSRHNDKARCWVIAPPDDEYKYFRGIERHEWSGFNWQYQAEQIKVLTQRFNVTHIGVDVSGIGSGVGELVQDFFPAVLLINYNLGSKAELVLKMLDVIGHARLKWRNDYKDVGASVMAIKRHTTNHGNMTFKAERNEEIGHADDFFAMSHAIINEPMNTNRSQQATITVGR